MTPEDQNKNKEIHYMRLEAVKGYIDLSCLNKLSYSNLMTCHSTLMSSLNPDNHFIKPDQDLKWIITDFDDSLKGNPFTILD